MPSTLVCQMVMDVSVITAKRCPVRDIRSDRIGCFSACRMAASFSSVCLESPRAKSWRCVWCSTGWIAGVRGVVGVRCPVASKPSSSSPPFGAAAYAEFMYESLSLVCRASKSSSKWCVRSFKALPLQAAYIRGAPMGQYMAQQCLKGLHSKLCMPFWRRRQNSSRQRLQ